MKRYTLIVVLALVAASVQTAWAGPASTAVAALVLQDGASLRAAAKDSAPVQAGLVRGDAVEIRAERLDYWQVWDYRRERGGFLKKSQTLLLSTDAPTLLTQLRLTLPQDGSEGLSLALAVAYIQAAGPKELASETGAEVLDALGQVGQRIAANTTTRRAALLDLAARYGLRFDSYAQSDGTVRQCYDGDAFRRVLSLPATASQRARAALALTRADCRPSTLTAVQTQALDDWRAQVLSHAALDGLPAFEKNRLLMRRASVAASRAFARGDEKAARTALADFAQIEPAEIAEDDMADYNDAAMRVNAVRWTAQPVMAERALGQLKLVLKEGATPGEHCLSLLDGKGAEQLRRCSFGRIALASAVLSRDGQAIALAAQPVDGWRELWVLRSSKKDGWQLQVLPPSAAEPGLGYAEFAGFVPGTRQVLVVQESRAEGRYSSRRFMVMELDSLTPQRQSPDATQLGAFQRWADPVWKGASLALR
ncbi:hypothetical protein ACFJGW_21510 [Burkholderiaceae bacterium UC74_6]